MSQDKDFTKIVKENSIYDCVTALNWICNDLEYYDDKIYTYSEVLEQAYYQLEAELSEDTIDTIITDFVCLGESIGIIQSAWFTYDGYGNLSIIYENEIRDNLICHLNDSYDDITDKDVFDILGIDYE